MNELADVATSSSVMVASPRICEDDSVLLQATLDHRSAAMRVADACNKLLPAQTGHLSQQLPLLQSFWQSYVIDLAGFCSD